MCIYVYMCGCGWVYVDGYMDGCMCVYNDVWMYSIDSADGINPSTFACVWVGVYINGCIYVICVSLPIYPTSHVP